MDTYVLWGREAQHLVGQKGPIGLFEESKLGETKAIFIEAKMLKENRPLIRKIILATGIEFCNIACLYSKDAF